MRLKVISSRIFFIFILIVLFAFNAYPALIINFEGLGYDEVTGMSSSYSNIPVKAIMIGSPFKGYENKKKDIITYDFFDTGNHFQRGSFETALGTEESFSNFIKSFHDNRIEIYSHVNLFKQKSGYKRDMWKSSDFTWDSFAFGDEYYIDIEKPVARSKISEILSFMMTLPIDKWVIDIRGFPPALEKEYHDYLLENQNGKIIILSDCESNNAYLMNSADYHYLREKIFIMPEPHLKSLKSFEVHSEWFHLIDSDSLSVNNYSAMAYLLSQDQNTVVPYSFLNDYGLQIFRFFSYNNKFNAIPVSDDKLILYTDNKIAAYNFTPSFSFWKYDKIIDKVGIHKSIFGGALLIFKAAEMDFFMFPESAAFWDIGAKGSKQFSIN
jgi:hypothetical protein